MKKSLLAISLISSFAFAEFETKAVVGASAAKIDDENYTQYNVGYTSQTRLENQIILGFGNTLSYGNVNSGKELIGLDMDLKAGYEIYKELQGRLKNMQALKVKISFEVFYYTADFQTEVNLILRDIVLDGALLNNALLRKSSTLQEDIKAYRNHIAKFKLIAKKLLKNEMVLDKFIN